MPALLALAAAATFGVADFVGGRATSRSPALYVTLVSNLAGGLLALVLVSIVATTWSQDALAWGAVGGALGLVGLLLLYVGLSTGPNRLVSPVSAVVSAVVPVGFGLISGERPGLLGVLGLMLTPIAVWSIAGGTWTISADDRRSLLIAVGAGSGFGLFFVCLAQTPDGAGAAPLVAARVTSVTLLMIAILFSLSRGQTHPANLRDGLPLAAAAGTLDMVANGFFLWATREGELVIVGALVSLFPVTTIALAVLVLHERLERRQLLGIALGITAAALLS